MDLQFARDITAVRDNSVDGDAQMVGDLLVGHTLDERDDHILLTIAKGIGVLGGGILEYHVGDVT